MTEMQWISLMLWLFLAAMACLIAGIVLEGIKRPNTYHGAWRRWLRAGRGK